VRASAVTTADSARKINDANTDLSQRTEEQAASLEETAATMQQLTSTVAQNTRNAEHANQLAGETRSVAEKGGAAVEQVVSTMGRISASASKITEFSSLIDSIAFQTNILALNAAVEAARAGEQGRGFAVVATEVRSLAQKSATAAKEIKSLIDASLAEVGAGTQVAENAGATMRQVVESVRQLTDIMGDIAQASREQNTGISQVGITVTQLEGVTHSNADLSVEAERLVASMSVFRLRDEDRHGERVATKASVNKTSATRATTATAATAFAAPPARIAKSREIKDARAPSERLLSARTPKPGSDEWREF
jgi:methyl-accepting chemotaxis protein